MNDEQLSNLNFELAILKTTVPIFAMLQTVLQNQMTILKALNVMDNSKVSEVVNGLYAENIKFTEAALEKAAPGLVKIIFSNQS